MPVISALGTRVLLVMFVLLSTLIRHEDAKRRIFVTSGSLCRKRWQWAVKATIDGPRSGARGVAQPDGAALWERRTGRGPTGPISPLGRQERSSANDASHPFAGRRGVAGQTPPHVSVRTAAPAFPAPMLPTYVLHVMAKRAYVVRRPHRLARRQAGSGFYSGKSVMADHSVWLSRWGSTAPESAERREQPVAGEFVGVFDVGFGEPAGDVDDGAPLGTHALA